MLLKTNRFDEKQLLAGIHDWWHTQDTASKLHSISWLLEGRWEDCGGNSLWWHGNGSSAAITAFSLFVSQQSHSDLSLTALDDALMQRYTKNGAFQEQKISRLAKVKVHEQLARQSHQLLAEKIEKICFAMEVPVDRAEKVTTISGRQYHVHLNRAWQAATKWSDADWQRAKEQLGHEIHQVIPVKHKLLNKLLQHHEGCLLQEVGTKATRHRSTSTKTLAPRKFATEEEVYGEVQMTSVKGVEFHMHPSEAETVATTWIVADTDRIANKQEREIQGITLH